MTAQPLILPGERVAASTTRASSVSTRLDWVDVCKGLCIVLVVYGHITGGLETSGAVAHGSAFDQLRSWVYLFQMPAFFFLSGLFAVKALGRPFRDVLFNKLKTVAYPYVVWTAIYFVVQEALARYVNTPPDAGAVARFLWQPYGYGLWFLYSLFLISLLFHLVMTARLPREVVLIFALLLHVASVFNCFAFWPILNHAMLNFVYFAIGGLYSEPARAWLAGGARFTALAIGVASLVLMTTVAWLLGAGPWTLLPALVGIVGAVGCARGLAGSLPGPFFSLLGFYSLEIYLGHPLFGTAARALLTRGQIHGALPLITGGVLLGIFGSLALAVLCRQAHFPYLYRWPAPKRVAVPLA